MKNKFKPESCYQKTNMDELRKITFGTPVVGTAVRFDSTKREVIVNLGYPWTGIIPENEITIYEFTYFEGDGVIPHQIASLIGTKIRAVVTEVIDEYTVRLSRRISMLEIWEEFKEGENYVGAVTNNIGCGVFLDIGNGITSYVKRYEFSLIKTTDTNLWISVGDTVPTKILTIEDGYRITASIKQAYSDDYDIYKRDDVVAVKIGSTKMEGGYFCEITPAIIGIIDTNKELKEGQMTKAFIKSIDSENKRMKLNEVK